MYKKLYSLEFIISLLFLIISLSAIQIAMTSYDIGTARRMGTGYFPIVIAGIIALISVLIIIEVLMAKVTKTAEIDWRAFSVILLSIALFSLATLFLGMVVGFFVLVSISALAQKGYEIQAIILSSIGISIFSWLVFSVGLELALPLFRWGL